MTTLEYLRIDYANILEDLSLFCAQTLHFYNLILFLLFILEGKLTI
jgi:hypothetical protein